MQASIETIAQSIDQLARVNPDSLYAVLKRASDFYYDTDQTREAIESIAILPMLSTQAANSFRQYDTALAERNHARIDQQMREAFEIGSLHMCLAVKLAAESKAESVDRAAEYPERLLAGLKLVEKVPSATEHLVAYCSDPSYGNPLMGGRDLVDMLVDQYTGISLIVPKIGKLTVSKMEDLHEDRVDIFEGLGKMGATATLGALDYVLSRAMINLAVEAMDNIRED